MLFVVVVSLAIKATTVDTPACHDKTLLHVSAVAVEVARAVETGREIPVYEQYCSTTFALREISETVFPDLSGSMCVW